NGQADGGRGCRKKPATLHVDAPPLNAVPAPAANRQIDLLARCRPPADAVFVDDLSRSYIKMDV
ncbi:hypothetical protein ABTA52_19685, partial [Acinetobacter baumannii]